MTHNPGFLRLVEQVKQRITECSVEEVKARLDRGEPFHFLDIREDHEFAVDHASGAQHLGRGILERDIETTVPNKEDTIVLYCGGGFRSALAADALQQMGYRQVRSMKGGSAHGGKLDARSRKTNVVMSLTCLCDRTPSRPARLDRSYLCCR